MGNGIGRREASNSMNKTRDPLPMTVLSGFLGSGKTSLVNKLLHSARGKRILVMVNDFGDISIDEDLIMAEEDGMLSLANGCVCCSMGADLYEAFDKALSISPPPDHLLIEASGVAEPHKIANFARAEPDLKLNAIVTMVDAVNFLTNLEDPHVGEILIHQVKAADLLLLSKSQLATEDQLRDLSEVVERLAATTAVVDIAAYSGLEELVLGSPIRIDPTPASSFAHDHDHEDIFCSWSCLLAGEITAGNVRSIFQSLPSQILRAKGIFVNADDGETYEMHRVGQRLEIQKSMANTDNPGVARFVIIGTTQPEFDGIVARLDAALKNIAISSRTVV
ncbi:CobW family GTP-binding protein [Sneathiella limimaris]|uniref:CobW family GTP-binding protein n=1 Tax=Sneathiella limimaris TaxID=1964213 RepID=UPI00146D618A|nr:GTP-binding protein [Sneathiella limimaris]